MRALSLVLALPACGHSAPPPPVIENRAPVADHAPAPVDGCTITGIVLDGHTDDPLPGTTIVVSGRGSGENVVLSNDEGVFKATGQPGDNRLTAYYADATVEVPLTPSICGRRIRVPIDLARSSGEIQRISIIYDSPDGP